MCFVAFSFGKTKASEKVKEFYRTNMPTWAFIEITNECNFKCSWCCIENKGKYIMSKDQAFELVDMLSDSGIKQITISGGEPTLVWYLPTLVKYIKDKGMIANIVSNGFFLTSDLINGLVNAGVDQVETNIDSLNPTIHDSIRGVKGAFNSAVMAIEKLVSEGISVVVQIVVTKDNEHEVVNIVKYAKSLGVNRVRVVDVMTDPDSAPTNYYGLLDEIAGIRDGLGISEIQSYDPIWKFDSKEGTVGIHAPCCADLGLGVVIDIYGNALYCPTAARVPMYNILETRRILEIDENIRKLRCGGCK